MAPTPARSPPFLIRELRWEDFTARMEGYFALYDEVQANPDLGLTLAASRPTEEQETEWFGALYRQVRRGDAIALVAEVDGRAVGMVTIASTRYGGRPSETSHVGTLGIVVDRAYRGRGIGSALMLRALEDARAKFETLRLSVFSVNAGARRLYERLGFVVTGRLAREVKRGGRYLDEETMALDLRGWRPPTGFHDG